MRLFYSPLRMIHRSFGETILEILAALPCFVAVIDAKEELYRRSVFKGISPFRDRAQLKMEPLFKNGTVLLS